MEYDIDKAIENFPRALIVVTVATNGEHGEFIASPRFFVTRGAPPISRKDLGKILVSVGESWIKGLDSLTFSSTKAPEADDAAR